MLLPRLLSTALGLTVASDGKSYASIEASSMMAGACAFFVYASCVSWVMMHGRAKALWVAVCALPVWGAVAFGLWYLCLR